jgi:DNA polymerase-3 subunit alpha
LYIKIYGKKGWNNDVRISFTNIQLLHDVLEEFSKKITLQLSINEISKNSIEKLNNILNDFKGKKTLNFFIVDNDENLTLNLPSRSYKIDISNELLEKLKNEQINFKLN